MTPHSSVAYVCGGKARETNEPLEEWEWFEEARVLRVDCDTGEAECVIRHVTPPELRPDDSPSIVFKAGARRGDTLYLCTQTEVLQYALPSCELVRHISLPSFNDLHHVQPLSNGNLAVVITGLDLVLELTASGEVVKEWPVLDEPPFARFSRETDYRKVGTTKPHLAHPNYAFEFEGGLWSTRFHQRDAIRLDDHSRRLEIGTEPPHDGHVVGDAIYFTTVRGELVVLQGPSDAPERTVYSIPEIVGAEQPLGWCRGLKLFDGGRRALVGFTRFRKTSVSKNVAWVKRALRRGLGRGGPANVPEGTMMLLLDLESRALIRSFDLEELGLNAVFSIHGDGDDGGE